MASRRIPALPSLLNRKLYKTGQTRGADDDEIYQNRVSRNSTVLIPYSAWESCKHDTKGDVEYENGYIVLVPPDRYFSDRSIDQQLKANGLEIGKNAIVFYERREHWNQHNPDKLGWSAASSRREPLGGQYVARVAATTAATEGGKINRGFTTTSMKGAGIRVYEYACKDVTEKCRQQLEALFWLCPDSIDVVVRNGMTIEEGRCRKNAILETCLNGTLLDFDRLHQARAINSSKETVCPLCLEVLSASGFFSRMEQAEGREVHDLTVTQVSLFHIQELRYGLLNHSPYNVAWGHHHCNVVVKDLGINETISWLKNLVDRNVSEGFFAN